MSTLFLVATPIGNLDDISPRALRTLRDVRLIAAEDTRRTGKLLGHFGIETRMVSYHDHNKAARLETVLAALESHDVALVSDAGAPNLNDPGYELVRAAWENGHTVSPIPGPSAPLAALTASGLPSNTFLYLGYLPRKGKVRRSQLREIARQPHTLIFLESPHRLLAALADLDTILGDRQMAVARELTKLHEEIRHGTPSGLRHHYESQPPRGEITLVVAGYSTQEAQPAWTEEQVREALARGLAEGETPANLAKRLAKEAGWSRRDVYRLAADRNGDK
jgi:16S rRNA (cytidine1402-2'-O)-methyltransferase